MAIAMGVVGTVLSTIGAMKQAAASKKAEKLRQRQMQLEAVRKRREIVREAVVARATALSNATAQGANEGSGLQGGYGQITSQETRNKAALSQDVAIGNGIFKANQQYASGGMLSAFGGGIQNLGSAIGNMNNA
jgi:hypothetical protein